MCLTRPPDLAAFAPSKERARRLDERMRERLGESLRHALERASGCLRPAGSGLEDFFARLAAGPVEPQAFALYAEFVLALEDDRPDDAKVLLEALVALPTPPTAISVLALRDPAGDPASARVQRVVDTDPRAPVRIQPPLPDASHRCRASIAEAWEWLEAGDPELLGEMRALLREIVLAAPRAGSPAFDGAAPLLLWGAILLNASLPRTVLETVRALAHEGAHQLLFGMGADDPLLLDDGEVRYPSPLRREPRPLLGILHASFVLARVQRVTRRLLEAGVVPDAELARARASLGDGAGRFADGLAVLDRHARLTPLGAAVLDGARRDLADAGTAGGPGPAQGRGAA
jgi:hypothetical protein